MIGIAEHDNDFFSERRHPNMHIFIGQIKSRCHLNLHLRRHLRVFKLKHRQDWQGIFVLMNCKYEMSLGVVTQGGWRDGQLDLNVGEGVQQG